MLSQVMTLGCLSRLLDVNRKLVLSVQLVVEPDLEGTALDFARDIDVLLAFPPSDRISI